MDITYYVNQYGYFLLLIALLLELIALPLPGETIMTYFGLLVFQNRFNWGISIVVAAVGSIIGITISYYLGSKLGMPFFEKYGKYLHLNQRKIAQTSTWFNRYGYYLITIGYFIPGVRHFTGYFSGIMKLKFRTFALYAYMGAIFWTTTFISLGKFLGPKWEEYHVAIKKYLLSLIIILLPLILIYYLIQVYRKYILANEKKLFIKITEKLLNLVKFQRNIFISLIIFIIFFVFMLGNLQDFLANEFLLFNEITSFIVDEIMLDIWQPWFSNIQLLILPTSVILLFVFDIFWILFTQKEQKLELSFLIILFGGGILSEKAINYFSYLIRNQPFIAEVSFLLIIFYGFSAFLLIRYFRKVILNLLIVLFVITISLLLGIVQIYLGKEYPSTVFTGYTFGVVWLFLHIIIFEILREIRGNKKIRKNF